MKRVRSRDVRIIPLRRKKGGHGGPPLQIPPIGFHDQNAQPRLAIYRTSL